MTAIWPYLAGVIGAATIAAVFAILIALKVKINIAGGAFTNTTAQCAHFGCAATVVFFSALTFGRYFVSGLIVLLAWMIAKEMFFDPRDETGDGKPDVEDFLFYMAGIVFALVVLQIHGGIMVWP